MKGWCFVNLYRGNNQEDDCAFTLHLHAFQWAENEEKKSLGIADRSVLGESKSDVLGGEVELSVKKGWHLDETVLST